MEEMKKKLLIVEDDTYAKEFYRLAFRKSYELTCANDGYEALEISKGKKFDIVLMDIVLHGSISGIDTMIKMRQDGHKYVPIIAVTAQAAEGDKERLLDLGFTDYLSKPTDLKVLRETIDSHLEKMAQ